MMLFRSRPVPTASFASVMGIAALGLAWETAVRAQGAPAFIGSWLMVISAAVFAILLVVWLARVAAKPDEVRAETRSAITASYFGTITISLSLLAAGAIPYSRPLAFVLWFIAAFGGAALLIYLLGRWIEYGIKDFELTPALFIPVVGNATTIYAAVPLGLAEIGWASFSFALLCWLTLLPITMYRLFVTEPRLPRRMAPQLAVMVSSPAVMASAWFVLSGGAMDAAFRILAYKALFFAILTVRLWKMAWGEPFNTAWWGWTFPAAALAGAFERAALAMPSPLYNALAAITLAAATLIVAVCVAGTVAGWLRTLRSPAPAVTT
jgi:tellurite resistance protein